MDLSTRDFDRTDVSESEEVEGENTEEESPEEETIVDFISRRRVPATPEEVNAVQVFAHRLVEDYGYRKDQMQTHPQFRIRSRPSDEVREYPIDIAVFNDSRKTEDNLFLIAECKAPDKRTGQRQLEIYLSLSPAVVGVWFNGDEHAYVRKFVKGDGTVQYPIIPNIPIRGQRIEDIGKFKRKDLTKPSNLKVIFKDIRNHLAGLTTGITRDEALAQQIINLLFCKIYDEKNTGPEEIVTFRYGVDEDHAIVKQRIVDLFDIVKKKTEYADVFDETDTIRLDDSSVAYIVGELQNFCVRAADREALGDAFEVFIGPALKGPEGQFFTPRNVVKMAVEILDPEPEEMIIDPACGSGGFLVVALEHVWDKIQKIAKAKGFGEDWIKEKQQTVATKSLRGIDKDSFLAKVTKAYMAILGDGRGGIFCENSLFKPENWNAKTKDKIQLGNFNVLLTNPPFGSKITVQGEEILRQFDLGFRWKKKGDQWIKLDRLRGKLPPQILFIERCLDFLTESGRMAIVLPDGVLGGAKLGYVAHFIKSEAKILALIDLPIETFTSMTKTHLVILEKKKTGKDYSNYPVFMAIARKVGHDRKGRSILDDDTVTIVRNHAKLSAKTKANFSHLGYFTESKWLEDNIIAKRYLPEFMETLEEIQKTKHRVENLGFMAKPKGIRTGANIGRVDYRDSGQGVVPYLLVSNITDEGINMEELKYVTKARANQFSNAVVKQGDIIINRTGNAGIAAIVPEDFDGALACGFHFKVVLKANYDPYYVVAFLNSPLGRKQMQRVAWGSLLEHITKDDLKKIKVVFLPDHEAKAISKLVRESVSKRVEARTDIRTALGKIKI